LSISHHRGAWEVRWRDANGRRRARRFKAEDAAKAFDAALHEVSPTSRTAESASYGRRGGIYSYKTTSGTRWRFVYRRSDGVQTTKRGFPSEKAARDARRRLVEQIDRGEVRHTKESCETFWTRWLARRKPYVELGTWEGYEVQGRKRLVPALGAVPLGRLGVEEIRVLVEGLAEAVDAGELAAKTVNNTLGTAVVCLNAAVEDGLIASHPALRIE
jgi:hypothetical protein